MGSLFRPDNFIGANNGAGNNWAKGYFNEGTEIIEEIMDIIRKEAELAESLNAF